MMMTRSRVSGVTTAVVSPHPGLQSESRSVRCVVSNGMNFAAISGVRSGARVVETLGLGAPSDTVKQGRPMRTKYDRAQRHKRFQRRAAGQRLIRFECLEVGLQPAAFRIACNPLHAYASQLLGRRSRWFRAAGWEADRR